MASSKIKPVSQRIGASLIALTIAWLWSAIAFGIWSKSAGGTVLALLSTIVVVAAAWILIGLPAVAAARLLIQLPIWATGILGAVLGATIIAALDREKELYGSELGLGLLALAASSGAICMVVYRRLIEIKTKN